MTRDIYLHADGEVEAEHVWVNEWADGVYATVVETVAPAPPAMEAPAERPDQDPSDQLLRDLAEIERVRDGLEREATALMHEAPASAGAFARLRIVFGLTKNR
jgi:hypothetical protein